MIFNDAFYRWCRDALEEATGTARRGGGLWASSSAAPVPLIIADDEGKGVWRVSYASGPDRL